MALRNESKEDRAARKQAVKEVKAAKKERKQGIIPEDYGQKECTLCQKKVDLLIRCQTSEEDHAQERWQMVCGSCWNKVSGGVVDGDDKHQHYRYGGLWKNQHKKDAR
ncbi:hypothetical protein WJX73_005191 [Symbiochloris irregularis]|uniref:Uncharacterized protein n=1 Tax=Symbiochloris irregularis TaxID=706552 RepID=A0AAW1NUX3_9CHLO